MLNAYIQNESIGQIPFLASDVISQESRDEELRALSCAKLAKFENDNCSSNFEELWSPQ